MAADLLMNEVLDRTARIEDRCTRIETRLTRFLESQGFETHVRRPFWNGAAVVVPSLSCALNDMLAAVPQIDLDGKAYDDGVPVIHQGKIVMHFFPV